MEDMILDKIIERDNLYKGQMINYKKFISMYKEYGKSITIIKFANLLGIKDKAYYAFKEKTEKCKDKDVKVKILLNRNLSEEEKSLKLSELVGKYNLNKGQKINYTFFREMYENFKSVLTEVEFAKFIGISESNLRNIRRTKQEAKIFNNIKLTNESIEKIRKNIVKQYEGKNIYYKEEDKKNGQINFLELYRSYRIYFSENEFAEILGISQKNLWYTKNSKANPKIKDIEKIKKVEKLEKEVNEVVYLNKLELEKICEKFELSIEDFITYYINKGDFFDYTVYKEALENNKGICIKRIEMEEADFEKYSEMFYHIAITIIRNEINKKYKEQYLDEDLKSNILIYIMYNCGDIVENFKYDLKLMERIIWLRARKYAQITFITEYKKDTINIRLNETKYENLETRNVDMDDIQIEKGNKITEEKIIELFKNYLSQGYSKEIIMDKISNTFNIEKLKILDMIKTYLLEKGKVKQNKDGDYEIGEE